MWADVVAIFDVCKLHIFAFLGAFVLYVMNRLNNKQPFSLLTALNLDTTSSNAKPKVILWDMVLSCGLGALLVLPMTSPSSPTQAVAAGLGLTGLLSAFGKSSKGGQEAA